LSVSAENVELVMSTRLEPDVELIALAGDPDASARVLDGIRHAFDPSCQCTMRFPGLAPVTYTGGVDGLGHAWRDWLKHWASYRIETEEVLDCGERVVVLHTARAQSRPGVPESTLRRATIWTVRDRLIVHVDFNVPYNEALTVLEPATAG
jgi:hypothetical protein